MANLSHFARQSNTQDKICLPLLVAFGYIDPAPAKSGARIETLNELAATHDAPSVFFVSQHHSTFHLRR
ncbi:hypothetical protein [Xenorhabdus szentirmaii]|uniref:hypothetical protein n=1 Tax=Xenorhabdus szentirmaii TaxID=290112 RepID=UPI0019B23FE4|nr:hypothetical protein [Xenorhabdus sp. 38]MBD2782661.1 ash family protein [Xenorhabdus sp. 38]